MEKYARGNKHPEAKELAIFFLEMSGRRLISQNKKEKKNDLSEVVLLPELGKEIREDIVAEIYEQIINYMYQKEDFSNEKQKLKTLNQIRNVLFVEHKSQIGLNDNL